jgi:hypothetical protein
MNLNNDVVYRRFRLGPLHQRHPGRSRSLIRHHNRLHQAPPCIQSSPLHHEACLAFASVVSVARRASISCLMCFGSYFAAFYRGEDSKQIPEQVVAVLWPGIATGS